MNISKWKAIPLFALIVSLSLTAAPALASEPANDPSGSESPPVYDITKPYEYPVVPGTEEWKTHALIGDLTGACQVPREILARMTTDALVETLYYHPQLFLVSLYSPKTVAVNVMLPDIYCAQELAGRPDREEAMLKFYTGMHKWIMENAADDVHAVFFSYPMDYFEYFLFDSRFTKYTVQDKASLLEGVIDLQLYDSLIQEKASLLGEIDFQLYPSIIYDYD